MLEEIFFKDINIIIKTIVIGILSYISLIVLLRISGKRTLSKMNAFDLIVTVAIGSILATIIMNKDVTIAQGITALSTLIIMQFLMTKISYHNQFFSRLIKSNPTLLFYEGEYLYDAMKRERILEVEIMQAVRAQGIHSLKNVQVVILETDGSFSVISNDKPIDTDENELFNHVQH